MKGIQKTDPDDARRARAEAGYFSVINYSVWSHQVIGEATVHRSDYPSADAVDEEIARTLKVWQRRAIEGSPKGNAKGPMKREATFLLKKATDSLILAIERFNRPIDRGRGSAVLILLDHVNIDPGSESSKKDI